MAVVGAGRLGTALALALSSCGYAVTAVVSRRVARARRAARLAGKGALALGDEQLERLPPTELVFITTPDDAVGRVAARLAGAGPEKVRGRIVLHASGALSSDVLAPLRARGFHTGSMHPLASVSEPVSGAERLRGAFFCVEGDRAAAAAARRVVRDLGGQSFAVRAEDKALYHAAAVMTAGHTVALFDAALEALKDCGLGERRGREALVSLLRGAVENLSARVPALALTGSFARADVETVRQHLAALHTLEHHRSGVEAIYVLLGGYSLRLAARGGADPEALLKIKRALSDAAASEPPPDRPRRGRR